MEKCHLVFFRGRRVGRYSVKKKDAPPPTFIPSLPATPIHTHKRTYTHISNTHKSELLYIHLRRQPDYVRVLPGRGGDVRECRPLPDPRRTSQCHVTECQSSHDKNWAREAATWMRHEALPPRLARGESASSSPMLRGFQRQANRRKATKTRIIHQLNKRILLLYLN